MNFLLNRHTHTPHFFQNFTFIRAEIILMVYLVWKCRFFMVLHWIASHTKFADLFLQNVASKYTEYNANDFYVFIKYMYIAHNALFISTNFPLYPIIYTQTHTHTGQATDLQNLFSILLLFYFYNFYKTLRDYQLSGISTYRIRIYINELNNKMQHTDTHKHELGKCFAKAHTKFNISLHFFFCILHFIIVHMDFFNFTIQKAQLFNRYTYIYGTTHKVIEYWLQKFVHFKFR